MLLQVVTDTIALPAMVEEAAEPVQESINLWKWRNTAVG